MTEYQKQRQQYLKSREDTICFTREELWTIIETLKEAFPVIAIYRKMKLLTGVYKNYRQAVRNRTRTVLVDNISLEIKIP